MNAQVINEKWHWQTHWDIFKIKDGDGKIAAMTRAGIPLDAIKDCFPERFIGHERIDGNIALNTGLQNLINLAFGISAATGWTNTTASIGVGDSTTPAQATDTNLKAATNKTYKGMDTGYPQRTDQTVILQSTFAGTDANYSWQEFVVNNAVDGSGVSLNRKLQDKGTKSSGETWVVQVSITFS